MTTTTPFTQSLLHTRFGACYASLGGYGSQTAIDEVIGKVGRSESESTSALYVGDFDPSGVDIERDFIARSGGVFDEVVRIAVTADHVTEFDLPPTPDKTGDPRSAAFMLEHGTLFQVEVEAFEVFHPTVLAGLVTDAIEERTDMSKVRQVQLQSLDEQRRLFEFVGTFDD